MPQFATIYAQWYTQNDILWRNVTWCQLKQKARNRWRIDALRYSMSGLRLTGQPQAWFWKACLLLTSRVSSGINAMLWCLQCNLYVGQGCCAPAKLLSQIHHERLGMKEASTLAAIWCHSSSKYWILWRASQRPISENQQNSMQDQYKA